MSVLEALALLGTRSTNLEPIPGGQPSEMKMLVEGALSKLSRDMSMYARIKYSLSKEEQAKCIQWKTSHDKVGGLLEALRFHLENEYTTEIDNWTVKGEKRLIELAVILDIMPNTCPACQGTRHRLENDKKIACDLCGETGVVKVTQEMCADYIGTDLRNYTRRWRERLDWLSGVLASWDYTIRCTLSDELHRG